MSIISPATTISLDDVADHRVGTPRVNDSNGPRSSDSTNASREINNTLETNTTTKPSHTTDVTGELVNGLTCGNGNGMRQHDTTNAPQQHIPTKNGIQIVSDPSDASVDEEAYDLICVGFGPASLSIAIALEDRNLSSLPRVLFLERQPQFAWHAGMLLPGSRMQISFIKDLATLRNPRSHFTFLNYLHEKGRLVTFTNLGTFLPLREEFNDYLTWCAGHFEDRVRYGETVLGVDPVKAESLVNGFKITSLDSNSISRTRTARHVVIAVGGRPNIPKPFPKEHQKCIHSSGYSTIVPRVLSDSNAPYKIAVIGGGQSAAEIFTDLHSRYPKCKTKLIIKAQSLRPSDDSPFVNEIFNPEKVSDTYSLDPATRAESIHSDKATNYGVVRLELLERIYEHFYHQRLCEPNPHNWQHQILPLREVTATHSASDKITLRLRHLRTGAEDEDTYDAVIVATGYIRNVHEKLLANAKGLLRTDEKTGCSSWNVDRGYRLIFDKEKVSPEAGVWLQGCCENTHGLSDTLLSILAVRSGELVTSIFGPNPSRPSTPRRRPHFTRTSTISPPPTPPSPPTKQTQLSKVMLPEIVPTEESTPLAGVPMGA